MATDADLRHLRRCIELAAEATDAGDEPFGSVLVAADGSVLVEDHNRVAGGDATRHPEFELARWAATNMTPDERFRATVYTSTEHCPMCAAAHGWVGPGRIVYASSAAQRTAWLEEWGLPSAPVQPCPFVKSSPTSTWRVRSLTSPNRFARSIGDSRAAPEALRRYVSYICWLVKRQ